MSSASVLEAGTSAKCTVMARLRVLARRKEGVNVETEPLVGLPQRSMARTRGGSKGGGGFDDDDDDDDGEEGVDWEWAEAMETISSAS